MALPACETFKYSATLPADMKDPCFPWPLQLGETIERLSGDPLFDFRLVGYSPFLRIADGGAIPDPTGLRTRMLRSRLTLSASSRENATHSDASFYIDTELSSLFKPGDILHLRHSGMWGTGLSLLRNNQLVFAVGSIIGMPLGNNVRATHPDDVLKQIGRFHQIPFSIGGTRPLPIPIEIHVSNEMRSLSGGTAELGNHQIWVERANDFSFPSGDVSAAISVRGACEFIPAVASAMLLSLPDLELTEWPK